MAVHPFYNKTVLITGGTGSFGKALARRLIEEDECKKVIVFSRDELKQWEMRESEAAFRRSKIRYFLGDVRDVVRLQRAFSEVNYIVHAAALKQVPAAEYNPTEFIKTNVIGAMNVIEAALNCRVEKVIALSTDKAVNPLNLYGATKLCSDKLFTAANVYAGVRARPQFSVVRYGNVLGSRGSVLPLWQKILASGAERLPITDARMTRFWITLPQAVDFVMNSFVEMRGAEVFIPKIPSMKIIDLAAALAPDTPLEYTGIRPGEKLHELMIGSEDARHTLELENCYIMVPAYVSQDSFLLQKFLGKRSAHLLPEGFSYTSDGNSQWLTRQELYDYLQSKA